MANAQQKQTFTPHDVYLKVYLPYLKLFPGRHFPKAIFLSDLTYIHNYLAKNGKLQKDGSFYLTNNTIIYDLDYTLRQLTNYIKVFVDMGFMRTYRKGTNGLRHVILLKDNILKRCEEVDCD